MPQAYKPAADQVSERLERAVERAALRMDTAIENMLIELPDAAPEIAMERLACSLLERQPTLIEHLLDGVLQPQRRRA
jgi:hypothetical protein